MRWHQYPWLIDGELQALSLKSSVWCESHPLTDLCWFSPVLMSSHCPAHISWPTSQSPQGTFLHDTHSPQCHNLPITLTGGTKRARRKDLESEDIKLNPGLVAPLLCDLSEVTPSLWAYFNPKKMGSEFPFLPCAATRQPRRRAWRTIGSINIRPSLLPQCGNLHQDVL